MDLVGDAVRQIVLFLPYPSLNRLRQVNFVFCQAIRRKIAQNISVTVQLSPSVLQTFRIKQLSEMADVENWLDAIKSKMVATKNLMRARNVPMTEFQLLGQVHYALALFTVAVGMYEDMKLIDTGRTPDDPFTFGSSAIGKFEAALRDINQKVYQEWVLDGIQDDDYIGGPMTEMDVKHAIEYCIDRGMLHKRIDGRLQFTRQAQWKIV